MTPDQKAQEILRLARELGRLNHAWEDEPAITSAEEALESALREALQPQWRPISSAPRGSGEDGPDTITHPDYVEPPQLLLSDEAGNMAVCRYDWYYHEGCGRGAEPGVPAWRIVDVGEPFYGAAYWMPKPPAPGKGDTHD